MPELPDITVYAECLAARCVGQVLRRAKLNNAFLLRTVTPPLASIEGATVRGVRRLGKRLVLAFEGERFLVIHLMIAGRLRWTPKSNKPPGRGPLATFEFDEGWLVFTEAGTKRRLSKSRSGSVAPNERQRRAQAAITGLFSSTADAGRDRSAMAHVLRRRA